MHKMLEGLFGKKCAVCGKKTKDGVKSADGKTFCCAKDKEFCEKQEAKGKPAVRGQVCEYC